MLKGKVGTRTGWLIIAASLFSATIFGLILWSNAWDHPAFETQTVYDGRLESASIPLLVKVTCSCPTVWVAPSSRKIRLSIQVSKIPEAAHPAKKSDIPEQKVTYEDDHLWVWIGSANPKITLPDQVQSLYLGPMASLANNPLQGDFTLDVATDETAPPGIRFEFLPASLNAPTFTKPLLGKIYWSPSYHSTFLSTTKPVIYGLMVLVAVFAVFFLIDMRFRQIRAKTELELAAARVRAQSDPEKSHYSWEIARIKLQAYFDRNLLQVNMVFVVAVIVVIVGFGFVLAGIFLCFRNPDKIGAPLVAAIAGVITQFIGATFMVIYRSTMGQANDFMAVLERINTVDMAVQVLDKIPEDNAALKNDVRAQMVGLLISSSANSHTGKTPAKKGQAKS